MHSLEYIKAVNAAARTTNPTPAHARPSPGEANACLANALFTVNDAYVGRQVVALSGPHYGKIGKILNVTLTAQGHDDYLMVFELAVANVTPTISLQNRTECIVLKDAL